VDVVASIYPVLPVRAGASPRVQGVAGVADEADTLVDRSSLASRGWWSPSDGRGLIRPKRGLMDRLPPPFRGRVGRHPSGVLPASSRRGAFRLLDGGAFEQVAHLLACLLLLGCRWFGELSEQHRRGSDVLTSAGKERRTLSVRTDVFLDVARPLSRSPLVVGVLYLLASAHVCFRLLRALWDPG